VTEAIQVEVKTLNDLDRQIEEASRALSKIEEEKREAIAAATRKIAAQFADRLEGARRARFEAEQAKRDFIEASSGHPWEGRRVYRIEPKFNRFSGKKVGEERIEGIVDVCRQSTRFPTNMRYGLPNLGKAFVRKLKKDGTPALQFHERPYGDVETNWKLAE
jgi:hypothetical protein